MNCEERCSTECGNIYWQVQPKEMRMLFRNKWDLPIFTPCDGKWRCYSETNGCRGWECVINEMAEWAIRARLEDLVSNISNRVVAQKWINSDLDYKLNGKCWNEWCNEPESVKSCSIVSLICELQEQVRTLDKLQQETKEFVNYL